MVLISMMEGRQEPDDCCKMRVGVFNKVSVFRYRVDAEKCVHCGKCAKACQMEVNPVENPNSLECIRCGRCKKICPTQAIQCGTKRK